MSKSNKNITKDYLGKLFSDPKVQALTQFDPSSITAALSAYFSGSYAKDQMDALVDLVHKVNTKVGTIEKKYIDKDFFETFNGKRLIARLVRSVMKDNRERKIEASANLIVNLHLKSKLSIDEKELYVEILDDLNPMQISILEEAVAQMRKNKPQPMRSFSWEVLYKYYEKKEVSSAVLLQSIRKLETHGLVNKDNRTITPENSTHFVTEFGEGFNNFINEVQKQGSPYL